MTRSLCAAAAAMVLLTAGLHAQPARPPAGQDVDETRTVTLLFRQHTDCVAVALDGAEILLDRKALEKEAAMAPAAWHTEVERIAAIEGGRAKAVLAALAQQVDGHGCHALRQPTDAEVRHLVLARLERGEAAARDTAIDRLVPAIAIRYVGVRCGPLCGRGDILAYLPGASQPFLVQSWWVS
jgi:hypothetical protein